MTVVSKIKLSILISIVSAISTSSSLMAQAPGHWPQDLTKLTSVVDVLPVKTSQSAKITLDIKNITRVDALRQIAQQSGIAISWSDAQELLSGKVSFNFKNVELKQAILTVVNGSGAVARFASNGFKIVIVRDTTGYVKSDKKGVISGRIEDSASGKGLAGAIASVIGTSLSSVSNVKGEFQIKNVPVGSRVLSLKALGFRTIERRVEVGETQRDDVKVRMVPSATALSEVVTTATGQQRRIEVPSDIVRIDPQKIMERAAVNNLTDLLDAAQVPGIHITRGNGNPGSPSRIRIRGVRSVTQSNDPVVIVDGNWIDATVGSPNAIDDIDPATIEKIEIVRGPSASTLYGQDAANGVIVITTKVGKVGPTRWSAKYQRNWGQTYGSMPPVYQGYGYSVANGSSQRCSIDSVLEGYCIQDSAVIFDPNNHLLKREGTQTVNRAVLGVSGGTASTTYSITGTTSRTTGVGRLSPIDFIRMRILDFPVNRKFVEPDKQTVNSINTGLTLQPSSSMAIIVTLNGSQADLNNNILRYKLVNPADVAGDVEYSLDTVVFTAQVTDITATESPTRRSNILLGGRLDWRVLGGVIGFNSGISRTAVEGSSFTRNIKCRPGNMCSDTLGLGSKQSTSGRELTTRINMSRKLDLGRFSRFLDLLPALGADYRRTDNSLLGINMGNIPPGERSISVGDNGSGNSSPKLTAANSRQSTAVAGWYANMRVGILERLYFDVGVRQDLGSAIRSRSGSGVAYPKIGGSWLVSDESFWPKNSIVETLRLRVATGYAAIQPDYGDLHGRYVTSSAFVDGRFVSAMSIAGVGNPVLKPERSMEVELGFDADMLGDRVNMIVTYARSENINTMINRPLPPSATRSSSSRKENVGRVRNNNFELTGTVRAIESKLARVELSHSMTLRNNKVVRLGRGVMPFSDLEMGRIAAGYPLAGVWVKHLIGYRDANSDGLIAASEMVLGDSLVYAGWSQPKYEAGFGINVSVLGMLSFDSRFSQRSQYVQQYTRENKYGLEDITAPLDIQAAERAAGMNNKRPISDFRWNSASVTYHVPAPLLRTVKLRSLSISLKGDNLGLWTNYTGRDPGVNSTILKSEVASEIGNEVTRPRQFALDFSIGL